ncbi:MAG: CvpA family protein [Gammaproteobacteria bacterium]|jgi:membrane protein required for colicin V production
MHLIPNILDIVISVVLLLPAVVGAIYGFMNILFSLIAWLCALGIAMKFSNAAASLLTPYVSTLLLRDVLAFVALFIVSLAVFTALGYLIVKLVGRSGLTAADRVLGFIFGLGLGAALVAVAVFLAGFTKASNSAWWQQSIMVQPFERAAIWARRFLPDNVVEYHRYSSIEHPINQ